MEDREFFDTLYQLWCKTTGAEDTYWKPVQTVNGWDVVTVDRDDNQTLVATVPNEVDADFICGLHGCMGDLVRRLHQAVDEADRLDREMDEVQQQLAAAHLRIVELTAPQ